MTTINLCFKAVFLCQLENFLLDMHMHANFGKVFCSNGNRLKSCFNQDSMLHDRGVPLNKLFKLVN